MRICASLTLEDIIKDKDRYIAEFYINDKKDKFVLDVTDLVEDKFNDMEVVNNDWSIRIVRKMLCRNEWKG